VGAKMKKLIKYELNAELVWPFFQDNLNGANALSIELLQIFKKEEGRFFALLPEDANLEYLYRFKHGCILPQNPIKYGPVGNLGNFHYREKVSISDDLANIIGDFLRRDENITCIIDDVIRYSTDKKIQEGRDDLKNYTAYSGRDVYYLLSKNNAEPSIIFKCLCRNRGYWHALSILSKISLKDYIGKQIEKPILTQICCNAQMIIVGAYDGEGYIFWEKSNPNGSCSF
jgi:hypothetical protein